MQQGNRQPQVSQIALAVLARGQMSFKASMLLWRKLLIEKC
jgi:hypothetical protein